MKSLFVSSKLELMRIGNHKNISFADIVILYNIDLYNDTD